MTVGQVTEMKQLRRVGEVSDTAAKPQVSELGQQRRASPTGLLDCSWLCCFYPFSYALLLLWDSWLKNGYT